MLVIRTSDGEIRLGSPERGQPYIPSLFIHVPADLWPEPAEANSFIALCKRAFAVLAVPRCTRAAMSFIERVVSRRNRTAILILSGSFFRRSINSLSLQPRRCNSSATIRSPLASAVSRHQVGAWGLQHQVIAIVHQAKGMHLPGGFLAGFGQGFDAVNVI